MENKANGVSTAITMILGIGVDIVEISRIERLVRRPRFLKRVFTQSECGRFELLSDPAQTAAGVFAAKEAVAKALGTGFSGFTTRDIEILTDSLGAPFVRLHSGAFERFSCLGGAMMHVTISHERGVAIAMAVLEGGQ